MSERVVICCDVLQREAVSERMVICCDVLQREAVSERAAVCCNMRESEAVGTGGCLLQYAGERGCRNGLRANDLR